VIDGVEFKVVYDAEPDLFVGVAAIVIETEGVDLDAIRSALADITAGGDRNRADPRRSAGAGQWARGRV
jgi:hypothetical protein